MVVGDYFQQLMNPYLSVDVSSFIPAALLLASREEGTEVKEFILMFFNFLRSVGLQVESQVCCFSLLFQREEHRCGQGRPDPGEGGLQVDHAGPSRQGAGGRRRGYQGRPPP